MKKHIICTLIFCLKIIWFSGYAQAETSDTRRDIIIVGAGISGLVAAVQLKKAGYNPLILEAQNRVGGRLWTIKKWGTSLELGAAWLHGYEKNPVYRLASDFNLKMNKATILGNSDGAASALTLYDAQGKKVKLSEKLHMQKLLVEFELFSHFQKPELESNVSLQTLIERFIVSKKLSEREESLLWHAAGVNYLYFFGTPLNKISGKDFGNTQGFGKEDLIFENGFSELAEKMADDLDILTGHFVTVIDYTKPIIKVETSRGTYYANQVIVTLPLGSLKKGVVQFSPELPLNKQKAIKKLGIGLANRVYLLFDKPFWDIDSKDPINSNNGWMETIGYMAKFDYGWIEFIDLYKKTSRPILMTMNVGEFAKKLETWPDNKIVEDIMQTLRKLYGKEIPEPIDYIITRWSHDPFSYGSYAVRLLNTSNIYNKMLAEPIAGKIFFAGEATNADYPSSVHGAYLSGIRAACEIRESAKKPLLQDSVYCGNASQSYISPSA